MEPYGCELELYFDFDGIFFFFVMNGTFSSEILMCDGGQ